MQETNLISDEWKKLNSEEKALVRAYVKQLFSDDISLKMVERINKIHEKYPDFDLSHFPLKN